MKILAFLQNQWFKDPTAAKVLFDRYPDKRNELIKRLLFIGCLTGKRLRQAFGDLCDSIIWEESNPRMADHSGGAFIADADHIKKAIEKHKPDVVICFGKNAWLGVRKVSDIRVFYAPHPAARLPDIAERLNYAAKEVHEYNDKFVKMQALRQIQK